MNTRISPEKAHAEIAHDEAQISDRENTLRAILRGDTAPQSWTQKLRMLLAVFGVVLAVL